MNAVRLTLITLLCCGLIWALSQAIYLGLKSGVIVYGKNRLRCKRTTNPFGFWILVGLFSCLICAAAYGWWYEINI